ncbi:unnamed protein product [Onchocerca ochengi]|uniref:C3H1-type domain-containing protein n=1 Tax=Onchocerca ochengi TaxID=42157 RepID=A0A182EQJ3_ONCOC|nr:unnamed protein product [Onchocerca ochengi]
MSNLHQQDQANGTAAVNIDRNIFSPKLGGITTTALSRSTALVDQKLCENCILKRNKDLLEQKMAATKWESQKQFFNEFLLREVQMHSTPLTYATASQLRTSKAVSQRNPELYKTTLCHFWSNGLPCRFGERCWFAHGSHELRNARFVYPGFHPLDYEVRMNSPNMLSSPYGQNLERNYQVANVQSTPATIRAIGRNIPIDKYHRISPIHENVNSMNWRTTQCGVSSVDSGVGGTSTNNSPEMIAKYRENLNDATHHFSPFQGPPLPVVPPHVIYPLVTSINGGQANFSGEAYNHWLSNEAVESNHRQLPPGLGEMSWWANTISNANPFINCPSRNIQPNQNATQSTNEQCCSTCTEPTIGKTEA